MKKLVDIKNLYKTYHTKKCEIDALNNINFTINEGDFIGIDLEAHAIIGGHFKIGFDTTEFFRILGE